MSALPWIGVRWTGDAEAASLIQTLLMQREVAVMSCLYSPGGAMRIQRSDGSPVEVPVGHWLMVSMYGELTIAGDCLDPAMHVNRQEITGGD